MINWDLVKSEVEGSSASVRSIARKYGTSHTIINKKIKSGEFNRYVPNVSVSKNNLEKKQHIAILGKTALRKIEEVKTELGKHYSSIDEPLIVAYAKTYERYLELEIQVKNEGITIQSPKTGASYLNPTYNALKAEQKTLLTFANQLGLSIVSRKTLGIKMGSDGKDQPSIFDFVDDINKNMDAIDV